MSRCTRQGSTDIEAARRRIEEQAEKLLGEKVGRAVDAKTKKLKTNIRTAARRANSDAAFKQEATRIHNEAEKDARATVAEIVAGGTQIALLETAAENEIITAQRRRPKAGTAVHAWCKPCAKALDPRALLERRATRITCRVCVQWLRRRPLAWNEALAADRGLDEASV